MTKADRWLIWPTLASVTLFIVLMLISGIPWSLGLLAEIVTTIVFLLAAASLCVATVVFLFDRRFRMAMSFLVAAVVPMAIRLQLVWVANCLHLMLTIWLGVGYLGPTETPDNHGFAAYDWSVGLAGGESTFLVRDPSRNVAMQPGPHTAELTTQTIRQTCMGRSKHIVGPYYICSFY